MQILLKRIKMPLVSVIMSVYNREEYVQRAIESILNQTLENFEFIIINDGSTDNTLRILEKYKKKDSRIRIIDQANKGLTKSLNIGIQISKGKFIARQDDDDISLPTRLEKQVSFLEDNKNIVLLGTNQYEVGINSERIGKYYDDATINQIVYLYNPIAHTSAMFIKDVFVKIGLYNEFYKTSQDFEAWMRLADVGTISMLAEPLVKRYIIDNSITNKKKFTQIKYAIIARFMHVNCGYMKALYYSLYQLTMAYLPLSIINLLRKILGK